MGSNPFSMYKNLKHSLEDETYSSTYGRRNGIRIDSLHTE